MYIDRNIELSEKISMAKIKVQAIIRRTATKDKTYFSSKMTGPIQYILLYYCKNCSSATSKCF